MSGKLEDFSGKEKGIDAGHQSPFESNIVILFVTVPQVCIFTALTCGTVISLFFSGMRCKRVSLHFHHRQGHGRLRCRRKTVQLRQTVSGQRFVRHLTD